jgi:pimeloyl-ACP methyl ester carboxylesterase
VQHRIVQQLVRLGLTKYLLQHGSTVMSSARDLCLLLQEGASTALVPPGLIAQLLNCGRTRMEDLVQGHPSPGTTGELRRFHALLRKALEEQMRQAMEDDAEVGYLDAAANVELLVAEWRRGAYDGVLGFSQGAAMAAMLCARLEMLERAAEGAGAARSPRFVILVNGFRSPLPSDAELGWYRALEPASLATPALVISGEYDTAVTPSRVAELAALFGRRTEHMVRGGQHAMPRQPVDLGAIAAFVRHAIRGADPNAGGTAWH